MTGKAPPPARLIIADDHAMVREGIRTMLAKEPDLEVVGEAQNGREALQLCLLLCPQLVLMDVRMPQMDGLEATRSIKEACPKTSVLIVTAHEDPDLLLEAIRAGVAGYVLKEATQRQLINAVRRVLEGESPFDQELAIRLLRRLAEGGAERRTRQQPPVPEPPTTGKRHREPLAGSPPPMAPLTDRELEVLRSLALGKTNRELARDLCVSLSTVKTHVHHLICKLGVSDRTQAAVRAIELGLLPNQEEEGHP